MTPSIDGQTYHFESRGLYDGVSVLWDEETGSLWHHVTGEAMSGPMKGAAMPIYNLLQMTAGTALASWPDLGVAISDRPIRGEGRNHRVNEDLELGEQFMATIAEEDARRPTMEIGVGLWNEDVRVYYPVSAIREAEKALVGELGPDERFVLYLEPGTGAPFAFHTGASSARWEGDELVLDDGTVLRDGILRNAAGDAVEVTRPLQLFTRWYGWALMYPDTEIRER